jgi:broad specificity phosphatase PhoE
MNSTLPQIFLVRHGENAGQHTGHADIPLTEQGERDAEKLKGWLTGLDFVQVLTSPLQRARRTAELAATASILSFESCFPKSRR